MFYHFGARKLYGQQNGDHLQTLPFWKLNYQEVSQTLCSPLPFSQNLSHNYSILNYKTETISQ